MQKNLTPLKESCPSVMVVSHERSGTHFTMNSLAACFDYVSNPWIDLDRHQFNINYFHAETVKSLMLKLADLRAANIVKSHHELEFFGDKISAVANAIDIVYVYRNPADVMASFWRFLHTWPWVEGPKTETVLEFAMTPPMGQLMRYQFRQHDTMLDRWANHVRHWLQAAARNGNIHVVKYEDLADRYETTVKALGAALGVEPSRIVRPSRNESVVRGGNVDFVAKRESDNRGAVAEIAMSRFPDLMAALGYRGNSQGSRAAGVPA